MSSFSSINCRTLSTVQEKRRCMHAQVQELKQTWLERLAFGPTRRDDALIQLWLGVFPVSLNQLPLERAVLLQGQIDAIRRHLSGTYRDLLGAMLADPALQISLSGHLNNRTNPNENLARELLELFSLGEGHYTENDVIETARALTGYRLVQHRSLVLDPRRHDFGTKTILGRTSGFDLSELVQWLCQQPATARHITRRLWLEIVGPLPSPARLEEIAAGWRQNHLSLPWLISVLERTPEARDGRRQATRLDSPIAMVSRSLALLGSRHPDALRISIHHLRLMGQPLFAPPSVKGWPTNEEWLNLRWLTARRRGLMALLADPEVWASRELPDSLPPGLTAIPPLTIGLPAPATRENIARLWRDPVWQLC
ncbi:DUF1800 family protein [Cyanobium sp. NIES-981]|uniref:DUF1800 family protein n=1 Tax=Cyanobium sp. NIES-981 TaxID=1851505 RepID=UPI0012FB3953|nr:DUF1800 family protein [Cyanobium sp. NIES-981]